MSITDLISASLVDEYVKPVIDEEVLRQSRLEQFRRPGLHPSEVGGVCPRLVVLKRILPPELKPKKDISPELYRIFNDGHAAHSWYQNRYLGPAGVLYGEWVCSRCKKVVEGFMPKDSCECQVNEMVPEFCREKCWGMTGTLVHPVRLPSMVSDRGGCIWCGQNNEMAWGEWLYREPRLHDPDLGIVGKCDGLLLIEGRWLILEIKTINDQGFRFLREPKKTYKGQGACYQHCMKLKPEPHSLADAVLFVFVCKNGAPKLDGKPRKEKEFLVYWDEESKDVIEDVKLIRHSLDNEYLPPMIDGCSQSKRNRYCDYWDTCSLLDTGKVGWIEAKELKP